MNYVNILEKCFLRVDEDFTDRDEIVEGLLKYGINQGYRLLAITVDNIIKDATIPYTKTVELPSDFFSHVYLDVDGSLVSDIDYDIYGRTLIFRKRNLTGSNINIKYKAIPGELVNDTDEILLRDVFADALTSYACYCYYMSVNNLNNATLALNEFNAIIGGGASDNVQSIQNVSNQNES